MRFYHAAPKETMMKIYAEGVLKKSWDIHSHVHNCPPLVDNTAGEHSKRGEHRCY